MDLLQELVRYEEQLHRPSQTMSDAELSGMLAQKFFEVGASGKRFTRSEALAVLGRRRDEGFAEPRAGSDYAVLELVDGVCALTYTLQEGGRRSFRSTLWRQCERGWEAVLHQGTVIPE